MSKRSPPTGKPTEPQRHNRARAVADLLPQVNGAAFRRFGFVQTAIVTRWEEIAGERLARVSQPESIRFPRGARENGILTLMVRGAHAAMMAHVSPEIVERVNRFFGYAAVERVVIRQGEAAPRTERRAPPSVRAAPIELGESLRTVADPELKAVLEALAGGIAQRASLPVVR